MQQVQVRQIAARALIYDYASSEGSLDDDAVSAPTISLCCFVPLCRVRSGGQSDCQTLLANIAGLLLERSFAVAVCRKSRGISKCWFQSVRCWSLLDFYDIHRIGLVWNVVVRSHGAQVAFDPGGCPFTHHWRRRWQS